MTSETDWHPNVHRVVAAATDLGLSIEPVRFPDGAKTAADAAAAIGVEIGQIVKVVPNHTCVVTNLFDRMVFHRNGIVTRVENVDARGTVW